MSGISHINRDETLVVRLVQKGDRATGLVGTADVEGFVTPDGTLSLRGFAAAAPLPLASSFELKQFEVRLDASVPEQSGVGVAERLVDLRVGDAVTDPLVFEEHAVLDGLPPKLEEGPRSRAHRRLKWPVRNEGVHEGAVQGLRHAPERCQFDAAFLLGAFETDDAGLANAQPSR